MSGILRVPNDGVLLVARLEYPLQPLTRFGFFQLNRGELNSPTRDQSPRFWFFPFGYRHSVDDSHSSFPRVRMLRCVVRARSELLRKQFNRWCTREVFHCGYPTTHTRANGVVQIWYG